eukprot:9466553-Pyramimonas_sp.AAC.1
MDLKGVVWILTGRSSSVSVTPACGTRRRLGVDAKGAVRTLRGRLVRASLPQIGRKGRGMDLEGSIRFLE